MSYDVSGNNITMTKGDTVKVRVTLKYKQTGETYLPQEGDEVKFTAVQRQITIVKTVPIDTLLLTISPEDTNKLPFGQYLFDMQLKYANGDIDTFIEDGVLYINKDKSE